MLNNFLLSKASVLFLTAIVLHSLVVPAWSMKEDEKDQNSNSAITVKNANNADENENNNADERNNTSAQDYFSALPLDLKVPILAMVAFDFGKTKKSLSNLAFVCNDWNINIINNNSKGGTIKSSIRRAWIYGRCGRNDIIDSEEQEIFSRFYKGALIYRPIEGSDEGMIRLPISGLRNPLESSFDLSQRGKAGQHLSIATGYRKAQTPANSGKLEIWIAPWFLIQGELGTTAAHFKPIMDHWKQENAPVGMFWTWGGDNMLDLYDHLTTKNMVELAQQSLCENWQTLPERPMMDEFCMCVSPALEASRTLHISFVNEIKLSQQ